MSKRGHLLAEVLDEVLSILYKINFLSLLLTFRCPHSGLFFLDLFLRGGQHFYDTHLAYSSGQDAR